jgi:hypothetical protein
VTLREIFFSREAAKAPKEAEKKKTGKLGGIDFPRLPKSLLSLHERKLKTSEVACGLSLAGKRGICFYL